MSEKDCSTCNDMCGSDDLSTVDFECSKCHCALFITEGWLVVDGEKRCGVAYCPACGAKVVPK